VQKAKGLCEAKAASSWLAGPQKNIFKVSPGKKCIDKLVFNTGVGALGQDHTNAAWDAWAMCKRADPDTTHMGLKNDGTIQCYKSVREGQSCDWRDDSREDVYTQTASVTHPYPILFTVWSDASYRCYVADAQSPKKKGHCTLTPNVGSQTWTYVPSLLAKPTDPKRPVLLVPIDCSNTYTKYGAYGTYPVTSWRDYESDTYTANVNKAFKDCGNTGVLTMWNNGGYQCRTSCTIVLGSSTSYKSSNDPFRTFWMA